MDSQQKHLDNLRKWRNFKGRDVSMDFLSPWFKQEVAKPFKQMHGIGHVWAELIPPEIGTHCRLERYSRGTLTVHVDSSAMLFELDRLLRSGLQQQLTQASRPAALSRIKLVVGPVD